MKYSRRAVCKRWRSIIDNPGFAQLHLETSTKSDCRLYMEPPVNGLVLLHTSGVVASMYIFNPSIRDCLVLPKLRLPRYDEAIAVPGFGFDNISKKFKVVHMCFGRGVGGGFESEVRVYTLGSNSWKKAGKAPNFLRYYGYSAYVDGSIHWLGEGEPEDGINSIVILSFDLGVEEFRVTKLSFHTCSDSVCDHIHGMVLGKYLSVLEALDHSSFDIWTLKDLNVKESWSRHRITFNDVDVGRFVTFQPVSFWRKGEITLLGDSRTLVSYNFETKRYTSLEIDGLDGTESGDSLCSGDIFSYIESLIPVTSASIGAIVKKRRILKNQIQDRMEPRRSKRLRRKINMDYE